MVLQNDLSLIQSGREAGDLLCDDWTAWAFASSSDLGMLFAKWPRAHRFRSPVAAPRGRRPMPPWPAGQLHSEPPHRPRQNLVFLHDVALGNEKPHQVARHNGSDIDGTHRRDPAVDRKHTRDRGEGAISTATAVGRAIQNWEKATPARTSPSAPAPPNLHKRRFRDGGEAGGRTAGTCAASSAGSG
jgi:hypothetical protein